MMDWSPVWISLKTASVSFAITFFGGIFAAYMAVRMKSRIGRVILDGIFTLPLVVPPTVVGFFLLYLFGVKRPAGMFLAEFFGVKVAFSWGAAVLAAVVMSFPLMYRSAVGAFRQLDEDLTAAARTLGMGECEIFFRVVLPNTFPGIISGGVLAFARGLGEFGATAMIAGNIAGKTRTLPVAVYSEIAAGNTEGALGYVQVITIIAFAAVVVLNVMEFYEGRKKGL